MGTVFKILTAIVFNFVVGAVLATAVGLPAEAGGATMIGIGGAMSFMPGVPGLREGVYKEIWTGEVVKALRGFLSGSWLDGIPDASSVVDNDAIHLINAGVDPDVLINNTTYPIPLQELPDGDIVISLDKFQTKVTPVTDDELYAISYDKMARVKESHGHAIADAKFKKAAHAMCANKNSKTTPVLTTSGEADGTGRKRMTIEDLVAMKAAMDNLGVPEENRRLVLCANHVNDLLLVSQTFQQQYNIDRNRGKIGALMGFEIYQSSHNPYYNASGVKEAVDKIPAEESRQCSFAFYTPRVFKATGSTKMYWSPAESDPEYQRNKIAFTHRFIAMPKKEDAGVVIY